MPLGRTTLALVGSLFGLSLPMAASADPPSRSAVAPTQATAERPSTEGADRRAKPAGPHRADSGRANRGRRVFDVAGPVATLPGFRLLEGGASRVYVELTAAAPVESRQGQGTFVCTLKGTRVLSRNNRNPLITTHFSSPVSRVQLVPRGADLDVVMDLRAPAGATCRVVPSAAGASRLEVDFAAGAYPLQPERYAPRAGRDSTSTSVRSSDQRSTSSAPADEAGEPEAASAGEQRAPTAQQPQQPTQGARPKFPSTPLPRPTGTSSQP